MSGRFSVVIRWTDNKLVDVQGGYKTREDAEHIAEARRRVIDNKGWAMYVSIEEAHIVGEGK